MDPTPTALPHRWHRLAALIVLAALLPGCVVAPMHPRPAARRAPVPAPAPALPPASVALYFYPMNGQPEAVQERDRYECYRWAVAQTGMDPGMTPVRRPPPQAPAAPPAGPDVVAGAATGAVVGSVLSSPRHAGEGAALGAIFGAMVGAANADARQRAAEAAAERHSAYARAPTVPAHFQRAMSACMEGRGYRVR